MTNARLWAAASALIFVCLLTTESFAGPEGYCDSFAREAANRKIGHVNTAAGTIDDAATADRTTADAAATDERWHSAYGTSFDACMNNYGSGKQLVSESDTAPKQEVKRQRRSTASNQRRTSRPKKVAKSSVQRRTAPKPANEETAEPVSTPEPPPSAANLSRASAPKQEAQSPEHCTNLVCWLRQSRPKPQ